MPKAKPPQSKMNAHPYMTKRNTGKVLDYADKSLYMTDMEHSQSTNFINKQPDFFSDNEKDEVEQINIQLDQANLHKTVDTKM